MTKAQIDAVIALITTGGLNTATEAVNAWNALEGELFPAPVKVEWNGTSSVSPTTDIVVYASLATGKVKFTFRFWKSGIREYCNGTIENYSGVIVSDIQLITFATSLHKPLTTSPVIVNCEANNTGTPTSSSTFRLKINDGGIFLFGSMNPTANIYTFNFDYIVAN